MREERKEQIKMSQKLPGSEDGLLLQQEVHSVQNWVLSVLSGSFFSTLKKWLYLISAQKKQKQPQRSYFLTPDDQLFPHSCFGGI